MSKKFGKFLLFSAITGAAIYGAYQYLQKKDEMVSADTHENDDDDFDDFSEDLDEDLNNSKERSYVSLNLDKAEAFATEAFHKAKEVISGSVAQVRETVKSVAEGTASPDSNFTDLTAINKDAAKASEPEENASPSETQTDASEETSSTEEAEKAAAPANEAAADGTERRNATNLSRLVIDEGSGHVFAADALVTPGVGDGIFADGVVYAGEGVDLAAIEGEAVHHPVAGLGGAGGEIHLAWFAVEAAGDGGTGSFKRRFCGAALTMQAGGVRQILHFQESVKRFQQRHFVGGGVKVDHGDRLLSYN